VRIGVAMRCQTLGIARYLKAMLPDSQIEGFAQLYKSHPTTSNLRRLSKDYDHFICCEPAGEIDLQNFHYYPMITFNAFHPDIIYVKNKDSSQYTEIHYNSFIIAECFRRGILERFVTDFFRWEVFASLGYLDRWSLEANSLKTQFANSKSRDSFRLLFYRIKRAGVFMWTLNHPKSFALRDYAVVMANEVFGRSLDFESVETQPDTLSEVRWPVYPGISEIFDVPSSTEFRLPRLSSNTFAGAVSFFYGEYRRQGITPSNIELLTSPELSTRFAKFI